MIRLWAAAVALIIGVAAGCSRPAPGYKESAVASKPIEQVLDDHADSLLALPGVVGTAIGRCGDTLCIRVFIRDSTDATRRAIPDSLGGHPVRVEVSGDFHQR